MSSNIQHITLLTFFTALAFTANALSPKIELQPSWIRVLDVERTDSATRVGVRFQYPAGYSVGFNSGAYLIAYGDSIHQYKIIGTENIELDKGIRMPASGQHEGVLLFENVPESVKVVDLVEKDPADTPNNVIGIHLDEQETRIRPKTLTVDDIIIGNGQIASEPWYGLDPSRYTDLTFYDKAGKTHIKGKINDYSPRCGISTVSVVTYDDFAGRQFPHVATIGSDGSFEMDVQLRYPQFTSFELGSSQDNRFLIPDEVQHKCLFLIPGDTLSVSTCVSKHWEINGFANLAPDYLGFEGSPSESAVIGLLADSLINKRYGLDSLYYRNFVEQSALMESETIAATENLCLLLDSVVADLPLLLRDIPISNYAKDILSAYAIGQIELLMEELEMHLRTSEMFSHGVGLKYDIKGITLPKLRYRQLIFDNPLLLCISGILLNRWENNMLLNPAKWAGGGWLESPDSQYYYNAKDASQPFDISYEHLDSMGLGNCFAVQLVQSKSFIEGLNSTEIPNSVSLERNGRILPYIMKYNTSDVLNSIVIGEYNDFVKDVMIADNALDSEDEQATIIDADDNGDILEKIIAPYRGNVLYLDFWAMYCSPCRAGMIRQKPVLEKLADRPFRALYIASVEEGVETCRKWLRKEGIKGEHIFVSAEDWKRLSKLFNFNQIPFGVLIGKDGKVIKSGLRTLTIEDFFLHKALDE